MLLWVLALCIPAAVAPGCLLYTDDVNRKPELEIEGPDVIVPGKDAPFMVTKKEDLDQDPQSLRLEWGVASVNCPAKAEDFPVVVSTATGATFQPTVTDSDKLIVPGSVTDRPFCVWARLTDKHGASVARVLAGAPDNRPPVAVLVVADPATEPLMYKFYTQFRLSAAGSSDPDMDKLSYVFDSLKLAGSTTAPAFGPCPGDDALSSNEQTDRCFVASEPGTYTAAVKVTDSRNATAMASITIHVAEDQLPCIELASPMLGVTLPYDPAVAWHFSVDKVRDDADPFPPYGGITFRWFVGRDRARLAFVDQWNVPFYDIPGGTYHSGDVVDVRVEVLDRQESTIDTRLGICGPAAPVCASDAASACRLRATWTVEFR